MTITFAAYTGPIDGSLSGQFKRLQGSFVQQPAIVALRGILPPLHSGFSVVAPTAPVLSGTLPIPQLRLSQALSASPGMRANLSSPKLVLVVGARWVSTFPKPLGRIGQGYGLQGVLGTLVANFSQAPPQTASVLNAALPGMRFTLGPTLTASTAAWSSSFRPSLSLSVSGVSALKGLMPHLGGSFLQIMPAPRNFFQLVLGDLISAVSSQGPTYLIHDSVLFASTPSADFIQALLDLIQYSDSYTRAAQVLQALADGVSMAAIANMIWQANLLDHFIASAVQAGTAQLTVLLSDRLQLGDAASALSAILAALHDGFYATLTLVTGDDVYTAWVMTPETKAMRSYSNFSFNSYAQLGDQFFGAGPAGIYRMGGTTDAGAAIASTIRTGLLNFGTQGMKGVQRAYLGATAAGELLMRVQALTRNSDMLEQTYRISPLVTDAPREYGVDVGRGFRSVYWTFELANDIDGAAFEVNDWHVLPVFFSGKLR